MIGRLPSPSVVRPLAPHEQRAKRLRMLETLLEVIPQVRRRADRAARPEKAAGLRVVADVLERQAHALVQLVTA